MAQPARGFGGLLPTEVDRISLGTHQSHDLHARVERRSARFSAGRDRHLSFALGRTRTVAIEVTEVAPNGVRIIPIEDQTSIRMAAIDFASAATAILARTLFNLIRG